MVQLAEGRFLDIKRVTEIAAPKISGLNRQIYQRLKMALSLELRRQIFVAVCDDLPLRDRLAASLQAELNYPSLSSEKVAYTSKYTEKLHVPQLVSLRLNLRNPNLIAQMSQWLTGHFQSKNSAQPVTASMPAFQIVGIEHLTRQSPALQWSFLSHLREIDRTLPELECNLLLWVNGPWLRSIQESAAEFWNWRTGLFEFEGDPTPAPAPDTQQGTPHPKHRPNERLSDNRADAAPPPGTTESSTQFAFSAPAASQTSQSSFDKEILELAAKSQPHPTHVEAHSPRRAELKDHLSDPGATESSATRSPSQNRTSYDPQSSDPIDTDEFEDDPADLDILELQALLAMPPHSDEEQQQIEEREISVAPSQQSLAPNTEEAGREQTPSSDRPLPASSLAWLSAQSEELAELVNLVKAGAKQDVSWGAPLLNSQSLQTLQQIEELHQQSGSPTAIAAAYQRLADLWRDRVDRGDSSLESLTIAIRAYEQMLQVLQGFASPEPDILNDLGNLYWMLSRHLGAPEQKLPYLERAIQIYEAALTHSDPHIAPQSYAMILNNLGAVYGDLARYRDKAENLQRSIAAYEEALRYRRQELNNPQADSPQRYAATLNNLGTAYWNLAQHQQPVTHLKQAIAAYNEAIRFYSPERQPLDYATLENNLGTAYWNLAQYEQPENYLLLAISAYQVALNYRTPEVMPAASAATQNNLGTAYWHLANHSKGMPKERCEYLQHAIAAYDAALNIAAQLANGSQPAKPLSFDIFSTHNNLGLAYYQIATDSLTTSDKASKSKQLETALHHHLQALQGWQKQADSYQTALSFVVQTIRAFYNEFGIQGQNLALSKLPGQILPEILRLL